MNLNRKCEKKYEETQDFDFVIIIIIFFFLNKTVIFSLFQMLYSPLGCIAGTTVLMPHQYFYLVSRYLKVSAFYINHIYCIRAKCCLQACCNEYLPLY